jgi:hypothetical protein
MDCKTARQFLEFARPPSAELDAVEAAALGEHLAGCPVCRSLAQAERRVDDVLGRAMRDVAVPGGLRERLTSRLRRRRRAQYAWRVGLSAAAAVLVAATVWLGLNRPAPRPVPELDFYALNWQVGKPPGDVEDWYRTTHHLPVSVPRELDYNFLVFFGFSDFQGQQVPVLLFIRGADFARVYVLADRQFNLAGLDEAKPVGYPVELLRDSADPHVRYLVVYTGDDLQQFLAKGRRPTA